MTVTEPRGGVELREPKLSLAEVRQLLADFMPEAGLDVVEVSAHRVVVMALPDWLERRPGGTLSGPAIFKAVDLSAFLAVNAYAGRVLTGVLTSGSINLLETAEPGPLEIVIEVAKLGRRMAVATAGSSMPTPSWSRCPPCSSRCRPGRLAASPTDGVPGPVSRAVGQPPVGVPVARPAGQDPLQGGSAPARRRPRRARPGAR